MPLTHKRAHRMQTAGAYWRHDGDPQHPHAVLASLKHSNGYFNASMVVSRPALLDWACSTLRGTLASLEAPEPDRVVGSAYGSIPFAYELAHALRCKFGFTERAMVGPMVLKRFELEPGAKVLVATHDFRDCPAACEMLGQTIAAVEQTGATVLPAILALCDRTDHHTYQRRAVISDEYAVHFWVPRTAPAIESGSCVCVDNPALLGGIVRELLPSFQRHCFPPPDWVIGDGIQSITLAYAVARELRCRAGFTEREFERSEPLKVERFAIAAGEKVMAVDDVITTGGTTEETIAAVTGRRAEVVDPIAAIADRTVSGQLGERDIVSLLQPQFSVWDPDACELCRQGSPALRPKGHWAELTHAS